MAFRSRLQSPQSLPTKADMDAKSRRLVFSNSLSQKIRGQASCASCQLQRLNMKRISYLRRPHSPLGLLTCRSNSPQFLSPVEWPQRKPVSALKHSPFVPPRSSRLLVSSAQRYEYQPRFPPEVLQPKRNVWKGLLLFLAGAVASPSLTIFYRRQYSQDSRQNQIGPSQTLQEVPVLDEEPLDAISTHHPDLLGHAQLFHMFHVDGVLATLLMTLIKGEEEVKYVPDDFETTQEIGEGGPWIRWHATRLVLASHPIEPAVAICLDVHMLDDVEWTEDMRLRYALHIEAVLRERSEEEAERVGIDRENGPIGVSTVGNHFVSTFVPYDGPWSGYHERHLSDSRLPTLFLKTKYEYDKSLGARPSAGEETARYHFSIFHTGGPLE